MQQLVRRSLSAILPAYRGRLVLAHRNSDGWRATVEGGALAVAAVAGQDVDILDRDVKLVAASVA